MSRCLAAAITLAGAIAFSGDAHAGAPAWAPNRLTQDLSRGAPLVVHVTVALCSNFQINCGAPFAGRAGDAKNNLYWGAMFGSRRFLDKAKDFDLLSVERKPKPHVLERVVYRRQLSAAKWGLSLGRPPEQIVVLDAVHGQAIDRATLDFWRRATQGSELEIVRKKRTERVRVHVAGYVGHNRLLDGLSLPARASTSQALPAFVLACQSDQFFSKQLRKAGATPLLMTRALMAPEGYVLLAALRAMGDAQSRAQIRSRSARAYAKYQKLKVREAWPIFARPE